MAAITQILFIIFKKLIYYFLKMFKQVLAIVALTAVSNVEATNQRLQVNTLNQVISELDILEKAKLNTQLEVEMLDFLQNEMEQGSL